MVGVTVGLVGITASVISPILFVWVGDGIGCSVALGAQLIRRLKQINKRSLAITAIGPN
jgi:hypothetical protein